MNVTALLNFTIDLSGSLLCILGILQASVSSLLDKRTKRYFIPFFTSLILFAASNAAGLLMRGRPGHGWRIALYVSNYLEFFFPILLVMVFSYYMLSITDPNREKTKLRITLKVLACVHVILLTVSQFTGLYYTIDANNVYHRSPFYPLSNGIVILVLILNAVQLIENRDKLSHRERIAFWIYLIAPVISIILQILFYGIHFGILAAILAALVLYVFILNGQTERYLDQEKQLANMRVNLLLNQIRPHFIFNTLTSIYVLCRDDPPRAMEVIQDFTEYLQANFTGIAASDLIIFADELHHTKAYLAVEAIRYDDKLTVEYDIRHTAFHLPALTLQPLVENAVKYGVGRGQSAEQILISSRAENDCSVITVTDDGPGFDPSAVDSENHVGIRNVRERLAAMCGGTMEIQSAPGIGTTVTVRIPSHT